MIINKHSNNIQHLSERPESSMTVGSDCSSTISSEDDDGGHTKDSDTSGSPIEDQDGSSSQTVIAASPAKRYGYLILVIRLLDSFILDR